MKGVTSADCSAELVPASIPGSGARAAFRAELFLGVSNELRALR